MSTAVYNVSVAPSPEELALDMLQLAQEVERVAARTPLRGAAIRLRLRAERMATNAHRQDEELGMHYDWLGDQE